MRTRVSPVSGPTRVAIFQRTLLVVEDDEELREILEQGPPGNGHAGHPLPGDERQWNHLASLALPEPVCLGGGASQLVLCSVPLGGKPWGVLGFARPSAERGALNSVECAFLSFACVWVGQALGAPGAQIFNPMRTA
jgi:hypothetical protein